MIKLTNILNEIANEKLLDFLLDKISKSGLSSLSNHEKTLLKSFHDSNIDIDKEEEKFQNKNKLAKNIIKQIPLKVNDSELEENIGRYVKYKNDGNQKRGLLAELGMVFEIIAIQKHWGHNSEGKYVPDMVGYRIVEVGKDNDFGRVGGVKDIEFVDMSEQEAIKINHNIELEIQKRFKEEHGFTQEEYLNDETGKLKLKQ